MVFTKVGSQGRVKLSRHCTRRADRVVEEPLIWVPWAPVRHTLRKVFELRHRNQGDGYPRPRWQRRGACDQGGWRCLGPLPVCVHRGFRWLSHSWGCKGALTCTWTPRRGTKR